MMELAARQYGGYGGLYGGGGYGGYVECCEGVVDPILLLGVIVGNYYIPVYHHLELPSVSCVIYMVHLSLWPL